MLGSMSGRRIIVPVDRVAASLRQRLQGRNLRITQRGAVHRTRQSRWLRGEIIPAPACGTATAQHDPWEWTATTEHVTCLHCQRLTNSGSDDSRHPVQLALFDSAA